MKKKLNLWTLAGFLIGPVLGSGVILLPPLALERAGSASFFAWMVTLVLMGIFAGVSATLALHFPGSEGLTLAVGSAFGEEYRNLCGWLLVGAICFGPPAVLLLAGNFLWEIFPFLGSNIPGALLFLGLCAVLLRCRISFAGTLSLICSTLIGAGLLWGSLSVLLSPEMGREIAFNLPAPKVFGETLVLLFWSIIGWEILGNYTLEIENPGKTIPLATGIAFGGICAIYLSIAGALPRTLSYGKAFPSMTDLLVPLFGKIAPLLLGSFGILLCLCTYIMVVGGVARLGASMAEKGELPKFLARKNPEGVPLGAATTLSCVHGLWIGLSYFSVLDITALVGIANGLFLLNSLLVVLSAIRLLEHPAIRIASGALALGFLILFALADRTALLVSVGVLLFSLRRRGNFSLSPQDSGKAPVKKKLLSPESSPGIRKTWLSGKML